MAKHKEKKAFGLFMWVAVAMMLFYCVILLFPLAWVLMNSLKGRIDFIISPFSFPPKLLFSNYALAFTELYDEIGFGQRVYLPRMLLNTLFYAIGTVTLSIIVRASTAYVAAKYSEFFVSKLVYQIVILTMILPIIGGLPSKLQFTRAIGFFDNMIGVWIMESGFYAGIYFLIFYATFKSISWEYAEAAQMDGASHFSIFLKIMIPLARTSLMALALLEFIAVWNDYYTPMVFLPSFPTVAYGLYKFQFSTSGVASAVTLQFAVCVMVFIPILIIYLSFGKKLTGSMTVGGIKG